ncbi:uncharacterized protein EV420DRAFT_1486665 [Desarmillaria tabescens]|uniref:Uncharacterized protein n=1 Tax=Armillaria tabescens TaxID=1929756 RepID=A0AA39JB24_ARMTA|nr:uncharacterized protein EV420DRAFT_1486665 [Desarmillaria tabescens]KAK0438491.1 hypothetical protein EV420DRAFT_1486665 [Desarmillaria tabescens]
MPNQHLPLVPDEIILPRLKELWLMEGNVNDTVLCEELQKVFNTSKYTLGLSSFKRMRKRLGFLSTRQQKHTVETVSEHLDEMREQFPKAGYFEMKKHLRINHNVRVSRNPRMCPEEFERESSEKFFIALVSMTSVEHTGYGPVLTQSDMGNENGNLARAHSFLHQWADRDLDNTLQHRWMAEKKNIPSEIVWSVFRAHFSFGYEGIFQFGIEQGWYDPKDFKVAFIPESIQAARQIYAPPDHPMLQLVPNSFRQWAECIWNVYLALLDKFHERHIVVLDEWHVISTRAYKAEETDKNQGGPKEVVGQDQATIPDIPDLNSDDELGDANAEDVEADEEDAEIWVVVEGDKGHKPVHLWNSILGCHRMALNSHGHMMARWHC